MRVRPILLALAAAGALAGTALADSPMPGVRPAGLQDEQPTAPAAERPPLAERAEGRAAVRGCPVDSACQRWQDELREFELERFPPSGSPWIDGDRPRSETGPRPSRATSPTELRPDLPWLADLELPDLPIVWDRRLIDYLVFYKDDPRGQRIMRGWLVAQGRFRDVILRELRRAKLPDDLLYVAMIESSYNPHTYSRVGASGLWQFMPDGGRIYGLTINRWLDERSDPVRATVAATSHWADLYQRFGDWHLAIAAYNAGYGAVLKGVARFNTNDFWALLEYENALPWEASIYVPKALAAAIVGHNRARFGFGDLAAAPAETWDEVTVPSSIAMTTIAQAAGCTPADLKRLNPHLLRGRTPPGASFVVRVPAGGGAAFATRLGQLRGDWDRVDVYVMHHGERFEDVATQFGISKSRLRQLNEIEHEAEVSGGTLLVVPRVAEDVRTANLTKANNDLYGSGVDHRPGEALIVAVPDKNAEVAARRRVFYRVVHGDSVRGIADALGVPTAELAGWNGLALDAKLHPRMVLQAWMAPTWSAEAAHVRLLDETRIIVVTRGSKEHVELAEARTGRQRIEYTASKRETFEQIGKKFGLAKRDVARINRLPPDTVVAPGESIVIYKVVDHTRSDRAEKQWKQAPRPAKAKQGGKKATGKKSGKRADAEREDGDEDRAEASVDARPTPSEEAAPVADRDDRARVVATPAVDRDGPVTTPD